MHIARIEAEMRAELMRTASELENDPFDGRMHQWVHWRTSHGKIGEEAFATSAGAYVAMMYAQGGDPDRARAHLARVAAAHDAFTAALEESYLHPRRATSRAFIANYALQDRPTREEYMGTAKWTQQRLRDALDADSDNELVRILAMGGETPRRRAMRERRLADLTVVLTDDDMDWADVRRFLIFHVEHCGRGNILDVERLDERQVTQMRLIARLPERFGGLRYLSEKLTDDRSFGMSSGEAELLRAHGLDVYLNTIGRSRNGGRERFVWFRDGPAPVIKKADSVAQLRLRWRGLVADHAYHSGAGEEPMSLAATVSCDAQVVRALLDDGAEPIVLSRCREDPIAEGAPDPKFRMSTCEGTRRSNTLATRRLYVGAAVRTLAGEREVECRAVVEVDDVADASDSHDRLWVHVADMWPGQAPAPQAVRIDRWAGAALGPLDAASGAPHRPATEVLGDGACDHPGAQWIADGISRGHTGQTPGGAAIVDDTLRLSCACCVNGRVAAIPAHRLPEGHPLLEQVRQREDEYLDAQQAHELIAGHAGGRAAHIDALRARDGIADLDIARYATGPDAQRTGRPTGSLRPLVEVAHRR